MARLDRALPPLLLLATLALLLLSAAPAMAVHYTEVTPDNSVLLANALGQREHFDTAIAAPICFIKIHSVQVVALEGGSTYIYSVHGCEVNDFRGFGVCKNGDCDVKPYQVQIFAPTGAATTTVQNVWRV